MKPCVLLLATFSLNILPSALAGIAGPASSASAADGAVSSTDFSIGRVLFPHFHFQAAYGRTSFDDGEDFAAGHHDPFSGGWTVQGFELGLSGRFNDHVESFATWHGFWDSGSPHSFDSEFEEYFLKLKNLPGGLELRGGQYLNRFGLHKPLIAAHMHNEREAAQGLIIRLQAGERIALVSDAGTPAVSARTVSIGFLSDR